jgi:Na+/melibiose symporter-like transporter
MLMLSSFCSSPAWFLLSKYAGKVKTWQFGSIATTFLYLLIAFSASKGSVSKSIGLCALLGIGMGYRFISDSIVPDIIDYDEFLTVHFTKCQCRSFYFIF